MTAMAMSTISLGNLDVILALHTQQDPLPNEWITYLELQTRILSKNGGDITKSRNFVITDGGAPNAKQRQAFNEGFGGPASKLAVLSNALNNPLKRGIATAIAWVNPAFKALPPEQWGEALKHLDIDHHLQAILMEFSRLQGKLAPVESLSIFQSSARRHIP